LQRAWELNQKLQAVALPAHAGTLPASHSFVSLQPENLVLTAVKKAADEDALVLRFYEIAGRRCEAVLRLPATVKRAVETNLLEKDEHALAVRDGAVRVATGPYQIKTVKVQLQR
jgi:alpha-mannosidase